VVLQLPQEVHAYTVITKRMDKVLTPVTAVGKTDPTEEGRKLHSFILLSSCSHTNFNT